MFALLAYVVMERREMLKKLAKWIAWAWAACKFQSPTNGSRITGSGIGVALSGIVQDQFTAAPLADVKVEYQSRTMVSDSQGAFVVSGSPTTSLAALKLSRSGYVGRTTYAKTGDVLWKMVPASFSMLAYDDTCRAEYGSGTTRWLASPRIYIDTRPRGFTASTDMIDLWVSEVIAQAPAFVGAWSAGVLHPEVVATASPPADLTAGTIVIHFSELDADYWNMAYIGAARATRNKYGVTSAGTVHMRYQKYAGSPGKRKGILGHELGHVLGYGHVTVAMPSFMQPSLGSKTDLLPFDILAAKFHYGRTPLSKTPDIDTKYTSGSLVLSVGRPILDEYPGCGMEDK